MRLDLLLAPGYGNSSPDHWQSHWARLYENASRVLQDDWETPSLEAWLTRLEAALEAGRHPALIVAHSRGCSLAVHWAARRRASGAGFGRVRGLLLVAPPDLDAPDFPGAIKGDFAPLPRAPLGLKTVLVASRNDPYCRFGRAEEMARDWEAEFVDSGDKGHLNALSGLGEWLEGRAILERLAVQTQPRAIESPAPVQAAPAAGTVLERAQAYLLRIKPAAVCDDCLAEALEIAPRQHANQKSRELESLPGYERRKGVCFACGASKKTVRRL